MSQPFVGECRPVGFNFAPVGWAQCLGQLVPISQNDTLFNLIGTTFGGDGQQTFGLPNLQGRVPIHQGAGYVLGQLGGVENVTLTTQQLPLHSHPLMASSSNGTANNFLNSVLAASPTPVYLANPNPTIAMSPSAVTNTGGNQPHNNIQPYLTLNWIISLFGIYPSQN
jgi:microcystin-dependent protein